MSLDSLLAKSLARDVTVTDLALAIAELAREVKQQEMQATADFFAANDKLKGDIQDREKSYQQGRIDAYCAVLGDQTFFDRFNILDEVWLDG